jgi:uncharacterized membrane protein required for colicin V production
MFNFFDVIVIALVIGFGYLGYETGILASLFYVLSGFVGIWAAQEFSSKIDLNFYILFFTSAGIVILAGLFIRKLLKSVFLGGFDRMVGAFLGVFLGVSASIFIVLSFPPKVSEKSREVVLKSYTGSSAVPFLEKFFPQAELKLEQVKDSIKLPKFSKKLKVSFPKLKKTNSAEKNNTGGDQ